MSQSASERSPLLRARSEDELYHGDEQELCFAKEDSEDPKQWPYRKKMTNVAVIALMASFFGSVGIANGGGTISDMFEPSERAGVFGWYLLGPLMGPTMGPLFGGLIVENLGWRWVFGILTIVCFCNTLLGFLFLRESYAPVILTRRCEKATEESGGSVQYTFPDQDKRPLSVKLRHSMYRPLKILFTQPIVLTMATFQAIIFATMYTLYTNMEEIFSKKPYSLSITQVGLLYLGPGVGFLAAVWFLVPHIDRIFNNMTEKNGGEQKPEFRLPLANIGSVLLPISLFWFAWTVENHAPWPACIAATFFFGFGQVAVFNTVQNYYIDAFSKYAASAIAAGAVFRALVGGVVPLFAPALFRKLGYGWGWSVFAFLTLAIAPSPLLFMRYGESLRERFAITL
ncbi:hypothetical protein FH972_021498 [Carpinus fangiana]|uniref:Major facilitator superfamily (MFS) profile domain-containing protein n=1 Tax=Carpinus fangiana TaxID=176857 RepID=A0A5N6KPV5_9ROSI|nr:hypothetical protein FH972_021498 [Carpinus fangiana]